MPRRTARIAATGWVAAAGWLAAVLAATLIGVGAIQLVGESIIGPPDFVLSQQEVARRLGDAAPAASPSAAPSPSASPSATAAPTTPPSEPLKRTLRSAGGSVVAICEGTAVRIVGISPAKGYGIKEYDAGPDREAEAKFEGDAGRSEIKVVCQDGVPVLRGDD